MLSKRKDPDRCSANFAGESSRYMTQLKLQMEGARTTHKDMGGAYFHGR